MDQRLLDPFAGSGQIGLEAISRGAIVWMNDRDRKRYTFIQTLVTDWQLEDQVTLTNDDWRKLLKKIADATCESFDIAYIDPPYDSVSAEGLPESEACLTELNNRGLIRPGGSVFVQHSHRTGLSDRIGDLKLDRSKKYGDSLLSRYSLG
jgi:16S rRNA (guanine(966)-N(2))-methyltransferase RsmD